MFGDDVVYLFEEDGLGLFGMTIFKGSKANIPTKEKEPRPIISIIETGGRAPEGTHNSRSVPAYIRPSGQVICRSADYDLAMSTALRARDVLFRVRNRFVNGTWWLHTRIHQEPFDLPPDENGRPRIAFNFDATLRPSPEASQ